MKFRGLFAAALVSITLMGCAGTAQLLANTAQTFSSSTKWQATGLSDATNLARIAETAIATYDLTVKPPRATQIELIAVLDRIHSTLKDFQAANAAGQNLALAVFNEALQAWTSYAAIKGIPL